MRPIMIGVWTLTTPLTGRLDGGLDLARVYLVDDHVILRDALCALLAANGHDVVGDSDEPTAAMAQIRQLAPDVLLLDLKLGLRSGFELLAEMQRRSMRVRTIVTTMSSDPRDVADALRYGADAYILKGSTGTELMRAIDAVLKGQRFFEGKVADLAVQALSTRDDPSALASLSMRERQVIVQVVNGRSSAEIGLELHLSPKTVDSYRSRLMAKVGVRDVQGLVRFALRAGLISADEL
jgi:two-component system, NarL family, invasion response regulator UvrY